MCCMIHTFSYALVGFIPTVKRQCMGVKYLKLYSAFSFPFLGWMSSPLCLKYEPLLYINLLKPTGRVMHQ
jgi:hypothetical protein